MAAGAGGAGRGARRVRGVLADRGRDGGRVVAEAHGKAVHCARRDNGDRTG